jgi:hypothetical protein
VSEPNESTRERKDAQLTISLAMIFARARYEPVDARKMTRSRRRNRIWRASAVKTPRAATARAIVAQ